MLTERQIEAFHAVVAIGSMTGAARHLGRTQSAVSRLILDLEQTVGFTLFHRSGTGLQPTENAILLHDEIHRSYVGLRYIEERARQLARGVTGRRITIGATPGLSGGLVPRALASFARAAPGTPTSLVSMTAESVVRSVADGGSDLGLATLPISVANIRVHWIGEAPCVAVLPEGDPLAAHDVIALAQLYDRQIMTVRNPFRLRRTIDAALRAADISPHALLETNTSLSAVMAAREGLGVAIVEPMTGCGIPIAGTVMRPIAEAIPSVWGVLTPEFRSPSDEINTLIAQLDRSATVLLPGFVRHAPETLDALQAQLFSPEPGTEDGPDAS